jgi:hypothetical protein
MPPEINFFTQIPLKINRITSSRTGKTITISIIKSIKKKTIEASN